MAKKKILLYGDSPLADTGLGNLHKIVLKALHETGKYDITVMAINHFVWRLNEEQKKKYPYEFVLPISHREDAFANKTMVELLKTDAYDLIITSHDLHQVVTFIDNIAWAQATHGTKWFNYAPVDRKYVNSVEARIMDMPDLSWVYSLYAKAAIQEFNPKTKVEAVWLPIDTNVFKIVDNKELIKKFREDYFKLEDKHFLFVNVNRNAPRKDLAASISAFAKVYDKHKNARLYLHCHEKDIGGNIEAYRNLYSLPKNVVMTYDSLAESPQGLAMGVPAEVMAMIYNSADAVISTSTGEGFGYSTVEALACGKYIIAPDNTSFKELLTNNRGQLVRTVGEVFTYAQSNVVREPVDIEAMSEAMLNMVQKPAQYDPEANMKFAHNNFNADKIGNKWVKAVSDLLK